MSVAGTSNLNSLEVDVAKVVVVLVALTKGGLNAATKSVAIEYAASGIRVNRHRRGCPLPRVCQLRDR